MQIEQRERMREMCCNDDDNNVGKLSECTFIDYQYYHYFVFVLALQIYICIPRYYIHRYGQIVQSRCAHKFIYVFYTLYYIETYCIYMYIYILSIYYVIMYISSERHRYICNISKCSMTQFLLFHS